MQLPRTQRCDGRRLVLVEAVLWHRPQSVPPVLRSSSVPNLGGAYRSTDGGISWTVIGAGNRLYSTHVDAVVDHPSLDGTVFLGTDNGVYRSTNCTPAGDCTFTLTRFENSAGKKVNRLVTALGIILVRPTQRPSTRQGLTAGAGGARIFGVRPIMEIPGKKWTRRDFR